MAEHGREGRGASSTLAPPMPVARSRFFRWPIRLLALACVLLASGASAETPRLHGGEAGLWLLEAGERAGTTKLYAGPFPAAAAVAPVAAAERKPLLRPATVLTGRVTHAAAADDGRLLWIVLEGGGVQRLLAPGGAGGGAGRSRLASTPAPDLPAGHRPLSVAAGEGVLWVVAEREEPDSAAPDSAAPDSAAPDSAAPGSAAPAPAAPDVSAAGDNAAAGAEPPGGQAAAGEDPPRSRALELRLLRGQTPDAPVEQREASQLADAGGDPVVLLRLDRLGWERRRLPRGVGRWVVVPDAEEGRGPRAVLLQKPEGGLVRFEPAEGGWEEPRGVGPGRLAAPVPRIAGVTLLLLEDGAGGVRAEALRPGADPPRVALLPGGASLPGGGEAWGFLGAAGRLWIGTPTPPPAAGARAEEEPSSWAHLAAEPTPERSLRLTPVSLEGTVGVAREVGISERPSGPGVADFPLLLLVLMVATAATFVFWRRDPRQQRLRLAERQRLATLGPRLAAAAIDAGPGLLVAWGLLGVRPEEVLAHWPGLGRPNTPAEVLPPLLFVAVTVLHTGVAEALTARSLGKALLRLRVADLAGDRPSAGRIALRAALKPVDLLAVLLLVLPLINPHRQRLCDLVAATVVLAEDRKPEETGQDQGPIR